MPIIQGQVSSSNPEKNRELELDVSAAVIDALKVCFASQLNFDDINVQKVAQEVIGKFAPGWVWVSISDFNPTIAGASPSKQCARFDVVVLENALDEKHQNYITQTVAQTVRKKLGGGVEPINLAVTFLTGNVDMSVPDAPDSLLLANDVHNFLRQNIQDELDRLKIAYNKENSQLRNSYYKNLSADFSRPGLVTEQQSRLLLSQAAEFAEQRETTLVGISDQYNLSTIEQENKEWWPTHCEALRKGRSDLLTNEYREDLVYFCQDGPFIGRDASTSIEKSWWKLLSQPGVTMSWPIVMFHGEIVYFEWRCADDVTNETTAKGSVTFVRRGHRGGVHLKTEQLTFYRNVNAKFFGAEP